MRAIEDPNDMPGLSRALADLASNDEGWCASPFVGLVLSMEGTCNLLDIMCDNGVAGRAATPTLAGSSKTTSLTTMMSTSGWSLAVATMRRFRSSFCLTLVELYSYLA
jgi:hypothetical protein